MFYCFRTQEKELAERENTEERAHFWGLMERQQYRSSPFLGLLRWDTISLGDSLTPSTNRGDNML
jgi:hypothetical protein